MTSTRPHDIGDDMNQILFINLVSMLGSSAMQHLGKLVNPITNKTEISLESAQITIDMIAMLKEKTKGNLKDQEDKMISDLLASLQMNYVETTKMEETRKATGKTEDKDNKENETADTDASQADVSEGEHAEKKDPKYHKSYEEKSEQK